MQSIAESTPIVGLNSNYAMRDVIFVEKIVQLSAFARAILRDDSKTGKLLVPLQSASPHDESAHNQFAHTGQLRERLSQSFGGHLQNLAFSGFTSRACQCRRAHEHSHVAAKSALAGCCENLLVVVTRLKYFQLAAQTNGQRTIAVTGFVVQFAVPNDASSAKRLKHGELPVIQFGMGDAFGVAVKLL